MTLEILFISISLSCLCLSEFCLEISFYSGLAGLTWRIFIYFCILFLVDLV